MMHDFCGCLIAYDAPHTSFVSWKDIDVGKRLGSEFFVTPCSAVRHERTFILRRRLIAKRRSTVEEPMVEMRTIPTFPGDLVVSLMSRIQKKDAALRGSELRSRWFGRLPQKSKLTSTRLLLYLSPYPKLSTIPRFRLLASSLQFI